VHHIIDEKSGRMMDMKYPCIVLEDVYCRADYHRFCPKAIWHYWRENWLRRQEDIPFPLNPDESVARGACPGDQMPEALGVYATRTSDNSPVESVR
jgi:hypothetical protein